MADQLLSAVIRLENQIQQQLQQEQSRAAAWLDSVHAEQAAESLQSGQTLTAENDRALGVAELRIEAEAEALVADEMNYCLSLEEISDENLLEVLDRQLVPRLVNPAG